MNIRPVRFPPLAAGARPTITSRAFGVPEARQGPRPVLLGGVGRAVWRQPPRARPPAWDNATGRHFTLDLFQLPGGRSHGQKATVSFVPSSRRKQDPSTVLCLVRHGTTATTGKVLPGRARGLHLSDQGRAEAAKAAEALSSLTISALYSSPLERTRETALAISERLGKPVVAVRGLIECDFGEWTGESLAKLCKLPEWQTVQRWPSGFRFPGGESFVDSSRALSTP